MVAQLYWCNISECACMFGRGVLKKVKYFHKLCSCLRCSAMKLAEKRDIDRMSSLIMETYICNFGSHICRKANGFPFDYV